MLALNIWKKYLVGKGFELESNHHSLKYLVTQSILNPRHRRQSEFIREYDFRISYIEGTQNVVIDGEGREQRIFSLIPLILNLRERALGKFLKDMLEQGFFRNSAVDIFSRRFDSESGTIIMTSSQFGWVSCSSRE